MRFQFSSGNRTRIVSAAADISPLSLFLLLSVDAYKTLLVLVYSIFPERLSKQEMNIR